MLAHDLNHGMTICYRTKGKIGLIIVVTACSCFIFYFVVGKEKLKNTSRKVVNHFKEVATEKEAVRVIRLLVAVITTLLSKWYLAPMSFWIVRGTHTLGESIAAVLPVVVVDTMLKLGYIVYTVIVGPFSFLSYFFSSQVAGVGGGMVVIIGGRTLQLQRFILNFIAKGSPLTFYDLYRVKLLFIRGVATIVYCVSAALESILRLFLLLFIVVNTARTSRRGESFWQSFIEKVVKPKSLQAKSWILVEDPSLRCKRVLLVILPFVLYCLRFQAKPTLKA